MNATTIGSCAYTLGWPHFKSTQNCGVFFCGGKKRNYEGHVQYFKGSGQWFLVVKQKVAIAAAGTKPHAIVDFASSTPQVEGLLFLHT